MTDANTCFICDIDREDFEQIGLNFKQHIKEDHNMWDYVFFRFYVPAAVPEPTMRASNARGRQRSQRDFT